MKTLRPLIGLVSFVLFTSFQAPPAPSVTRKAASPFRVRVEVVNLLVTVMDKEGRFLTDIPRERFSVLEDGVRQAVTSFAKETSLPLTIALMVDSSSSVRRKLRFEKRAAAAFLQRVLRKEDQAVLVEFDTGTSLLQDFTNDAASLVQAMSSIEAGGGTALFDAICRVSRHKLRQATSRRAIVLVSDGADLHSRQTIAQAVEAAQRAEATIYAIGTTRFSVRSDDAAGEEQLEILTGQTGGRVFLPESVEELADAFSLINQELRSQYSIVYQSTNPTRDGRFREVKVRIKDASGLSVRCKKGYYATSQ